MKESTVLVVFTAIGTLVPFLLIAISLVQPIRSYASEIVLAFASTPGGIHGIFIMDISQFARSQLIQALFVGFMSGVMFAVAFVKWIEQRRSQRTSSSVENAPGVPIN